MEQYKTTLNGYRKLLADPANAAVCGVPTPTGERTRKVRVSCRRLVQANGDELRIKWMPHAGMASDVDVFRVVGGTVVEDQTSAGRSNSPYTRSEFGGSLAGRLVAARLRVRDLSAQRNGVMYGAVSPVRTDIADWTPEEIVESVSDGNMAVVSAATDCVNLLYRPETQEEYQTWVRDPTVAPYDGSSVITDTEYPSSNVVVWKGDNSAEDYTTVDPPTSVAYTQGQDYTLYDAGMSAVKYEAGVSTKLFVDLGSSKTTSAVEYIPSNASYTLGSSYSTTNPITSDEDYMCTYWNPHGGSGVIPDVKCGGNQWYEIDHADFGSSWNGTLSLNFRFLHPSSGNERQFLCPDDGEVAIAWDNSSSYSCPLSYRCRVATLRRIGNVWYYGTINTNWMSPTTSQGVKYMTWMDPVKYYVQSSGSPSNTQLSFFAGSFFVTRCIMEFKSFTTHNTVSYYKYYSHKNRPVYSNVFRDSTNWNYNAQWLNIQGDATTVITQGQEVTGVNQGSLVTYSAGASTTAVPQRFWVEFDAVYEFSGQDVLTSVTPNPVAQPTRLDVFDTCFPTPIEDSTGWDGDEDCKDRMEH